MNEAREFIGDDGAYLSWLEAHPHGYVVNARRDFPTDEFVLHGAWCPLISTLQDSSHHGGFTEREYVKVCANSVTTLMSWSCRRGRANGSFTSVACTCSPLREPEAR